MTRKLDVNEILILMTDASLIHRPWKLSHPGRVIKLPVAWDLAVAFVGYSSFLHQLQMASHDVTAIWPKKLRKTKFQISNSKETFF